MSNPSVPALRTPDDRFTHLPGFDYAPHYIDDLPGFSGLRMHYVDEGPREAAHVFLCLHGEPTWAYLYRRMIPIFLQSGARVVAPDFFGFGRSDKPTDEAFYTFSTHYASLKALLQRLDLRRITLVCQDWGGLLGLALPADLPERFARLIVMNTMLAGGDAPLSPGFIAWRDWVANNPDLSPGRLLRRSCAHVSEAEAAAYDAPFPDARFKAGVRRFPQLVPDRPDADGAAISRRARDWWRDTWRGSTFMAIGMTDPVLGEPVMRGLATQIRGCPDPTLHAQAGHFAQEWGEDIAQRALDAFARG